MQYFSIFPSTIAMKIATIDFLGYYFAFSTINLIIFLLPWIINSFGWWAGSTDGGDFLCVFPDLFLSLTRLGTQSAATLFLSHRQKSDTHTSAPFGSTKKRGSREQHEFFGGRARRVARQNVDGGKYREIVRKIILSRMCGGVTGKLLGDTHIAAQKTPLFP